MAAPGSPTISDALMCFSIFSDRQVLNHGVNLLGDKKRGKARQSGVGEHSVGVELSRYVEDA
jgi:hypothetical protein